MALSCARGGSAWILGKLLLRKSDNALAQLPRKRVQLLSLEVFRSCGDVALRDVVSGHGGGGLLVGLGDLGGLFQP
mgnify:CR=1 FL=1